jgi:hypothetical protein
MKLKTVAQVLIILGAVMCLGAPPASAEAPQIPSSAVSCYFVGRF